MNKCSKKSIIRPLNRQSAKFQKFTLIELLVVIAIIAILASFLLPALKNVKSMAKSTLCKSNLKQLFLGFNQYSDEWQGYFPCRSYTDGASNLSPYWWESINICLNQPVKSIGFSYETYAGPYMCPEFTTYAAISQNGPYGVNGRICPRWPDGGAMIKVSQVKNLSSKILLLDTTWFYVYEAAALQPYVAGRHTNGNVNILYCDGHVDNMRNGPALFSPTNPWHFNVD
jgi:prepilin-type processing-associated H-X9-DG protein/prepilin-type N-terminal cleavage/methylation domain-containing protein